MIRRTFGIAITGLVVGLGIGLAVAQGPRPSTIPPVVNAVQPLPDEQVGELFGKIQRKDPIPLPLLYRALIGPQTALRADAASALGARGDATSVPHLIHALTDESTHVGGRHLERGMETTRYWANKSLIQLTGQDFKFKWDDPLDQRNAAALRWMTWYQTVQAAE